MEGHALDPLWIWLIFAVVRREGFDGARHRETWLPVLLRVRRSDCLVIQRFAMACTWIGVVSFRPSCGL